MPAREGVLVQQLGQSASLPHVKASSPFVHVQSENNPGPSHLEHPEHKTPPQPDSSEVVLSHVGFGVPEVVGVTLGVGVRVDVGVGVGVRVAEGGGVRVADGVGVREEGGVGTAPAPAVVVAQITDNRTKVRLNNIGYLHRTIHF